KPERPSLASCVHFRDVMNRRRRVPPRLLLAAFAVIWAIVALKAADRGQTNGPTPPPQSTTAAPAPGDYVGQATCLTCHEEKHYQATLHGLKSNVKSPAATHGCESCH